MLGPTMHLASSRCLHDTFRAAAFAALMLLLLGVVGCTFDSVSGAASCKGEGCSEPRRSAMGADADADADKWKPSSAPDAAARDASESQIATQAPARVPTNSSEPAETKPAADDDAGADSMSTDSSHTMLGPCSKDRPQKEICNTIDDDCDDKVDEECECPSTEPVACYDGPRGTLDVGICRAGTRTCEAGTLGPCIGAVLPGVEACNAIDDDCNGEVDDVEGRDTDIKNCGYCGNSCVPGESCCAGRCVNPLQANDPLNCGECGRACTEGGLPGCCNGGCVDLLSDTTCGACNNACGLLKLGGGFLCSCRQTNDGPQCVAQMEGDEQLCR
jgi:hypothetical protein